MSMRFLVLPALLLTAAASAQTTAIWTPPAYAFYPGDSSSVFPWNRATASLRYQQIYGAANFTAQSFNFQVLISRLRFRAPVVATTTTWAGGSWPNVTINMSTSATPYTAASATFAANHGGDLTNVYMGPVTVQAGTGSGTGVPGPIYIDIPLTTPFLYNPTSGDLCLEVQLDGRGWTGTSINCDVVVGAPAQMTGIYDPTSATAPAGIMGSYGLVTQFTCTRVGYAYAATYGTGCSRSGLPFYEYFATAPAFDLANSSLTMIFDGNNSYSVVPGISSYVAPTAAAIPLAGINNVEQTMNLASPLPTATGPTSSLTICTNGYVSTWINGLPGPSTAGFLHFSQTCFSLGWHAFDQLAGGPVKFEQAGNVSYVTWYGVRDLGGTSSANASTMQIQFDRSNGNVHMIWRTMSTLGGAFLVGFKAGGPYTDPGPMDISATLPASIACRAPLPLLALSPSGRPITGTTINLVTSNIPGSALFGANVLSFTQYVPGIDLTGIGMPRCNQYVGFDITNVFLVSGPATSVPLYIPNNAGLAGLQFFIQSAAFSAVLNTLGAITSNGLELIPNRF